MLAAVESAKLAEEWIRDITAAEGILGGALTIHAVKRHGNLTPLRHEF
jgi:hypothetical protein